MGSIDYFQCKHCGKIYQKEGNLQRHMKKDHETIQVSLEEWLGRRGRIAAS